MSSSSPTPTCSTTGSGPRLGISSAAVTVPFANNADFVATPSSLGRREDLSICAAAQLGAAVTVVDDIQPRRR